MIYAIENLMSGEWVLWGYDGWDEFVRLYKLYGYGSVILHDVTGIDSSSFDSPFQQGTQSTKATRMKIRELLRSR